MAFYAFSPKWAKAGFREMLKDFQILMEKKKDLNCLLRYYIKQIDSILPCVCLVRSNKTSKYGKNISDTLSYRLVCHIFCSYHVLTSSVIYYWTDAR